MAKYRQAALGLVIASTQRNAKNVGSETPHTSVRPATNANSLNIIELYFNKVIMIQINIVGWGL